MRASIVFASLLVGVVPQVAQSAARPTANLRYTRGEGAARCPDAATIRDAVAARLGRDPWDQAAPRLIIVAVGQEGEGLRARVELRGSDGQIAGLREMTSPGQDCIELAAAVELAISIAIDPLSFTSPAPASGDSEQEQATTEPKSKKGETIEDESAGAKTQAPKETRMRVDASVGGLAALGSAPSVAGGIALQGRLRWERLSVALEGRFDLPAYQDIPGGQVSSTLLMAGGVGCVHMRAFFGCGLFYVGALRGAGHDIAQPERTTLPYAAAGARLGLELPLYSIMSLRFHGDLLATLTHITLKETDSTVEYWSTPPLSGAFGAAVAGTFK